MANDDTAVEKQEKDTDSQEDKVETSEESKESAAAEAKDETVAKLEAEIEELKKKADENWNQFLLEKAENENVRRRAQNDIEKAKNFAIERFVQELIPVKDSLEMGLAASKEEGADVAKLREGTELTLKMFADVTAKFGIETVDPLNESFNPEFHQAMTLQESDKKPNTVLAVMQKGYLLNGRLIRPAMVVVSKTMSKESKKDKKDKDKGKDKDSKDQDPKNGTNIDEKA